MSDMIYGRTGPHPVARPAPQDDEESDVWMQAVRRYITASKARDPMLWPRFVVIISAVGCMVLSFIFYRMGFFNDGVIFQFIGLFLVITYWWLTLANWRRR